MNSILLALALTSLMIGNTVLAQPQPAQPNDPLGENLFPPELVMRFESEIALTGEQRETIEESMQKAKPRFDELHEQLQSEVAKFGSVLKGDRVDEKAALAHFEKIQKLEHDIKQAHLSLLIGIKNRLTPEQQTKLQTLKKQVSLQRPPPSISAKMEKVKNSVESWQAEGKDPSQVAELMQQFPPLMKAGKFKEAEAVLDKALELLGARNK